MTKNEKRKTTANLIRQIAREYGHHHSNRWIKNLLEEKYGRVASIQQIAFVLGGKLKRPFVFDKYIKRKIDEVLSSCGNDKDLARKIFLEYIGGKI